MSLVGRLRVYFVHGGQGEMVFELEGGFEMLEKETDGRYGGYSQETNLDSHW